MARTESKETNSAPSRRALLKGAGVVGVGAALAGSSVATAGSASATPTAAPGPTGQITAAGVTRGVAALKAIVDRDMAATTVPGLAVAVVYDGVVRYLDGVGVRQVGKPGGVTPDTVFQLASVSKPLSSTVIASALTKNLRNADWNATVQSRRPGFTLADPWVGEHVTVADMFSHRSGLPDHAGDLLEDLGYTGDEIIAKLAQMPLKRFRDHYDYTNYGLTAGAEAISSGAGLSWQALAAKYLWGPLGMHDSSFTFADLQRSPQRAALHALVNGKWQPDLGANNDGQAPAGGASSSVRDLSKWLIMLLAQGTYGGQKIIDPAQLIPIWRPQNVSKEPTAAVGDRAGFYGLGWNVGYDDTGDVRVSHSGAFGRGAATAITLVPTAKLAIVVLTNGSPVGLPEAISFEFIDIIRYGKSTQDWLKLIGQFITPPITDDQTKYSKPAANPSPARDLSAYVGTYPNRFYGDLTVSLRNGSLSFNVGPDHEQHPLQHYSGDDFFFETTGENMSGFSGAVFAGSRSRVTTVTINAWNRDKLGVFTRS